jgi:hypothetical protein
MHVRFLLFGKQLRDHLQWYKSWTFVEPYFPEDRVN